MSLRQARKSNSLVRRSPTDYVLYVLGPAVILKFTIEDMNVHEAEALTVMTEG